MNHVQRRYVLRCLFVVALASPATAANAAELHWRGTVDNLWSNAANWNPAAVPAAGDDLAFPPAPTAIRTSSVNDLTPFTAFGRVEMNGHSASGNAIAVDEYFQLHFSTSTLPLRATGLLTFSLVNSNLDGSLDVNGQTVRFFSNGAALNGPITGSGTIDAELDSTLDIRGGGSFAGEIRLFKGAIVEINSALPGANVRFMVPSLRIRPTTIAGGGSFAELIGMSSAGGVVHPGGAGSFSPAILSTGNAFLIALRHEAVITGTTPGSGYGVLAVTGTVHISETSLLVLTDGFVPAVGDRFVIIANDGIDPVNGTFLDYPEGSVFAVGSSFFRISYAGGTGNDVELTAVASPCSYSIMPTSASPPAAGGNSSFTLTTDSGCPWTTASNASWIAVTSAASGSGPTTVTYTVGANSGAARSGTITAAGQTFTVNQAAFSCSYSISPTSATYSAAGGSGSVSVTAPPGCNWLATSNAGWIMVTSGAAGTGNGTVQYTVASNGGAARSATVTIAGQTFTVSQDAPASCSYVVSPTAASLGPAGGTVTVSIATSSGCGWTSQSSDSWITITSGPSGSGSGTSVLGAQANTSGSARDGAALIAGSVVQIHQSACASSTPQALAPADGTRTGRTITLSWTPVSGAFNYIVRITDTAGNLVQTFSTSATEQVVQLPPGTYEWVVEAHRADCPSVMSAASRFSVAPARRRAAR